MKFRFSQFALSTAAIASSCLLGCGGGSTKAPKPAPVPVVLATAHHDLRIAAEDAIVVPTQYTATLSLDPKQTEFTASVEITVDVKTLTKQFYLNGRGLKIVNATMESGGTVTQLEVTPEEKDWLLFSSPTPLKTGAATLSISYSGKIDDTSSFGIFRQEAAGEWYLFTQFEARGARRAFPSFDQPNLKVPWTLNLDVPEGLVALTNTPEVSREAKEGRQLVHFAASKPLPSYLVAFAVGPFDLVDIGKTRNGTPVRVAAPKGRGAETSWVVESTLPIIEILEDYTGIAYPYAKLDLVSIPSTGSFGAMENAGLITYTETLLLSKDNSLGFKRAYASVGAHELAHQWFGNLVTNAWWDDLWLNESFATWAAAKTMAVFEPSWRADVSWLGRRSSAMSADRLASARVIHQPIVHEGDIGAAFDGITYAKGASILTMFEGWMGAELFQKGIQHYLGNNQWKAATAQTFLEAMDQGTGKSVSEQFVTFIDQPGTPLLRFDLVCDGKAAPQLTVEQERYLPLGSTANANEKYRVPVCVRYPTANGPHRQCSIVTEASQVIALEKSESCPEWIVPNAGATGYYRAQLSESLQAALLSKADLSAPEEMAIAADLRALASAGKVSLEVAMALVPRLAKSRDEAVVASAASLANLGRLVDTKNAARYTKWLRKHFGKRAKQLGWKPKASELPVTKELRTSLLSLMIFEGQDKGLRRQGQALAKKWLKDPASVDPDLAGLALQVGAHYGSEKTVESYLAAIKATSDRSRRRLLLLALGRVTDAAAVSRSLAIMLDADVPVRESARSLLRKISGQKETSAATFDFVVANFEALRKRFGGEMQVRLSRVAGAQCDASKKEAVEQFLKEKISVLEGGENASRQALERFNLCVTQMQAQHFPAL